MSIQSAEPRRHRVVIVGSGFGGLTAAQKLKHADVDVTLIGETSHHLFQPLLYQLATGILSVGEIAPATRLILRDQRNARVLLGKVEKIDLTAQTVTSKLINMEKVVPFDSLIVAAGAQQSYFGNDHFATFAPGMKTIDNALELRGRILGAFEAAEVADDPAERTRRLTFVVVGAGPTGVEVAGQIAELATRTLKGAFRTIEPKDCRVILLDAAPAVLPPMGEKLGLKAQRRLESMGVEVQLNTMVTNVDYMGITLKDKDGTERRIDCAAKVWSAGVQASPLGKQLADQSDGTEIDRAGRVVVEPDLTIKGHRNVFVVGDMMSVPGVPGMAQGAIQGATYATKHIKNMVAGTDNAEAREPFKYWDKGSMATIARFDAVAQVGKWEFGGFIAWLAWLVLHLYYLVGFRNRFVTVLSWFSTFAGRARGQMVITEQMVYARLAMEQLETTRRQLVEAEAERLRTGAPEPEALDAADSGDAPEAGAATGDAPAAEGGAAGERPEAAAADSAAEPVADAEVRTAAAASTTEAPSAAEAEEQAAVEATEDQLEADAAEAGDQLDGTQNAADADAGHQASTERQPEEQKTSG